MSRWRWFIEGLPSIPRARALFRVRRFTMTTPQRARHLWDICSQIVEENVKGSLVECGVWRGGSAGIMGLLLKHRRQSRNVHLFDSFEGLPEPTDKDGNYAAEYSGGRASGELTSIDQCRSGLAEVHDFLFEELDLDKERITFHVGWFQDTMPRSAHTLGPIAVLRLDGDWYESTWVCLEHLYHLISPGGVVILDDFHVWEGCARAVREFRSRASINAPMEEIDGEAVYWRVPPASPSGNC